MLDVVAKSAIPFDTKQLDRLMDQAGIDVLIANSKHNIHYLLGGHRSIFFDYMDAMGISRYLPLLVYPKGAPEKAAFFGHRLEAHQKEVAPFWTPEGNTNSAGSVDAMQKAVDYVRKSGVKAKRVGVEMAFLPADAAGTLRGGLADSEVKDGLFVLERLRAKKRPDELAMLRKASDLVVESMKAVIAKTGPGMTKQEQFEMLRVHAPAALNRPDWAFTVDYPEDLELVRRVFRELRPEGDHFPLSRVIRLIEENPEIRAINRHLHDGFDK